MKERKVALFNDISKKGLQEFGPNYQVITEPSQADLWLVRSADLHQVPTSPRLRAVARAGAGVNNIPIQALSDQGVVVFNTPGANANGVAELVVAAMLLSSRDLLGGANWLRQQPQDDSIEQAAEQHKKAFTGYEIRGKRLGVIGLGAVGHLVANTAVALGMEVYGYDPFISIEFALKLSRSVHHVTQLQELLEGCDFLSIHVPLTDKTRHMLGPAQLHNAKPGAVLLNFSRDQVVDEAALLPLLQSGHISKYVSDFANKEVMAYPNTIVLPHLGAATLESEENCAVMAVRQAQDYLNNGNIVNSVNFPTLSLGRASHPTRVLVLHRNVPAILSHITTLFGENSINIDQLVSASRGPVAAAMFDLPVNILRSFAMQLAAQKDILKVRVIYSEQENQDYQSRKGAGA